MKPQAFSIAVKDVINHTSMLMPEDWKTTDASQYRIVEDLNRRFYLMKTADITDKPPVEEEKSEVIVEQVPKKKTEKNQSSSALSLSLTSVIVCSKESRQFQSMHGMYKSVVTGLCNLDEKHQPKLACL
jgi:hypothetical protein